MKLFSMMVLFLLAAASAAWSQEAPAAADQQVVNSDVEALLNEALVEQGAGEKIAATITGRTNTTLYRGNGPLSIAINAVDFDAKTTSFKSTVDVFDGEQKASTFELVGRYDVMTEIPVLTQRFFKGDLIEASDIATISIPEHRLRKDTVQSADDLIGQTPRRIISEQRPIRIADIEKPRVMKKGDGVQLSFHTPAMEIRTLGVAMQEGATGDTIRVRNSDSQMVIQATITGPGAAEVAPQTQLSLNQ